MLNFYKVRTPILLLLFSIIYLSGCNVFNSQDCCEDNCEDYVFHFPWEVKGVDEFASVGDTITFSSRFSDNVIDQTYGDTFKLKDFKLPLLFSVNKLDTIECDPNYENFTRHIEVNAEDVKVIVIDNVRLTRFDYYYDNDIYTATIKLVIKEKGFFLFTLSKRNPESLANDGYHNEFDGYCRARNQYVRFPFDNDKKLSENYKFLEDIISKSDRFCVSTRNIEDFSEGGFIFEVR